MKIAIIGGSFDPIHDGHLAMARYVLSHHLASQVWFMLSNQTPLKDRTLTPFEIRATMVKKAIAYNKKMKVCTLEKERDGISYTIDTVRECKRRWKQHSFVWLIGNDQAKQLHAWKDIDALSEMIEFYVFPRNQKDIACEYPYRRMNMELLDVSSSEIREGHKLWLVNKAVKQYMAQHYMYVDSFAKAHMSERRYLHSQSVAKLCVELAKCHQVDEQKAYCAGILHDICKEWGKDRLAAYLRSLDEPKLIEAPAIWHGYAGAYYISQAFGIHDREIRRAIYHHVTGDDTAKLSMILYISDKLDPSRGYDSSQTLALCKKDLESGYHRVQEEQKAYLTKEKVNIHESGIKDNRKGD